MAPCNSGARLPKHAPGPQMTLGSIRELGGTASCLCNQHSPNSQRVNGLRTKGTPMGAAACPRSHDSVQSGVVLRSRY